MVIINFVMVFDTVGVMFNLIVGCLIVLFESRVVLLVSMLVRGLVVVGNRCGVGVSFHWVVSLRVVEPVHALVVGGAKHFLVVGGMCWFSGCVHGLRIMRVFIFHRCLLGNLCGSLNGSLYGSLYRDRNRSLLRSLNKRLKAKSVRCLGVRILGVRSLRLASGDGQVKVCAKRFSSTEVTMIMVIAMTVFTMDVILYGAGLTVGIVIDGAAFTMTVILYGAGFMVGIVLDRAGLTVGIVLYRADLTVGIVVDGVGLTKEVVVVVLIVLVTSKMVIIAGLIVALAKMGALGFWRLIVAV